MDAMAGDMSFRSSIAGLSNKLATNSLEDVDFKLLEMFDKAGSFDLPSGQELGLDTGFLSEAAMPQMDHGSGGAHTLGGGGRSQEGLQGMPSLPPFQPLQTQSSLPAQLHASNSFGSSQSYPWRSSPMHGDSCGGGPSPSGPLGGGPPPLSPGSRSLAFSTPSGASAEPRPAFPPIPAPRSNAPLLHRSARRASMPASAAGGVSNLLNGSGLHSLWENRSTPPLWSIGEGEAFGQLSPTMRPALSAEEITVQQMGNGTTVRCHLTAALLLCMTDVRDSEITHSCCATVERCWSCFHALIAAAPSPDPLRRSAALRSSERSGHHGHEHSGDGGPPGSRRPRPSVRSASVGAHSDRPLSPGDLDLGLASAKAKERNRRAQKRFRERQKVRLMVTPRLRSAYWLAFKGTCVHFGNCVSAAAH